MNLKAKTEWRRSGERARGSTAGPAQPTGLATASCSSPATGSFSGNCAPPLSWELPFLKDSPFPTPACSGSGPCLGSWCIVEPEPWPGRAGALQAPSLLALRSASSSSRRTVCLVLLSVLVSCLIPKKRTS